MRTRLFVVLLGTLLVAPPLLAQQKTITGKVTSEQGTPLSGVTVSVKGTSTVTSSNAQGDYSIAAAAGQTLQFRLIGTGLVERAVGSEDVINVQLRRVALDLDAVVVTALGETDTPNGWRPNKPHGGCLIDVASGQTVARGFAMPHSPRVHRGRVWMLHSGAGQLVLVDPASSRAETVTELPGYTRGLALYDRFAFVGLSKIRETSTFGGMPIAERRPELKCGVGVVDLGTGRLAAHLEFVTGVEEIFDVQVVPGARCPALSGPYASLDGAAPIWTVPQPPHASGRP